MLNTLLFIHIVIAMLLIIVVLLQKTGTDGLSGIGGGISGGNMGLVSSRSAATFLTRVTIILAVLFFLNAIILGNLSSKKNDDIVKKLEQMESDNFNEQGVEDIPDMQDIPVAN